MTQACAWLHESARRFLFMCAGMRPASRRNVRTLKIVALTRLTGPHRARALALHALDELARRARIAVSTLCLVMAWAAGVDAQAAGPKLPVHQASPADRAAAQALFEQGRELMARGRAKEACPRFEESQRLDSGLGTQYHLATCYEAVTRLASAHTLFLEVAAQARILGQARREQLARERADALVARLTKLTIEVPHEQAPELLVERDGSFVGRAQWGLPVPVDPGVHRVRASAPGLSTWVVEIDVPNDAGVHTVSVPPLAAARESSFFTPTSRKAGLVALGVGVATIGLGSVFAIQAHSKNQDSNEAGCVESGCPDAQSQALRRQALDAGNRATWAMGLGALGLGTAAVLFWVVPGLQATEGGGHDVSIEPVGSLRGASVRVAGRF